MSTIKGVMHRTILDSHADFTTEFMIELEDGSIGCGASPQGETISIYEDQNVPSSPESVLRLMREDGCFGPPFDQRSFDAYLDGRIDRIGRNNAFGLSLAFFKAMECRRPLFELFGGTGIDLQPPRLCLNILNGGWHAYTNPVLSDFHEFMLVARSSDLESVLVAHKAIQRSVKERLRRLDTALVAGNRVHVFRCADNRAVIEFLLSIRDGLGLSRDFDVMIDASASDLWRQGRYHLFLTDGSVWGSEAFGEYWHRLIDAFGLAFLEDPFHEQDADAWRALTTGQTRCRIVGDNFYSSDADRITRGAKAQATHGVVVKPNQAGTVTAVRKAIAAAHRLGQITIASHRSISTEETFLSVLSCLESVPYIKIGPLETDYSAVVRLNEIIRLTTKPAGTVP